MKQSLDIFLSARSFQEEELRGKTAVIIDVLRASSTIVTALANGAQGVIPVQDREEARKISQSVSSPNYLLCGENGGRKIEGYDLGNSPYEYLREKVQGKTIIFKTSNGTEALKRASLAEEILVGSFLNMETILKRLRQTEREVALVCAGWIGHMALEDMLCAGYMVNALTGGNLPVDARDGAKVAFGLYQKFGDDIEQTLRNSNHAKRLADITPNDDIGYCSRLDRMDILPRLEDGIITNAHA